LATPISEAELLEATRLAHLSLTQEQRERMLPELMRRQAVYRSVDFPSSDRPAARPQGRPAGRRWCDVGPGRRAGPGPDALIRPHVVYRSVEFEWRRLTGCASSAVARFLKCSRWESGVPAIQELPKRYFEASPRKTRGMRSDPLSLVTILCRRLRRQSNLCRHGSRSVATVPVARGLGSRRRKMIRSVSLGIQPRPIGRRVGALILSLATIGAIVSVVSNPAGASSTRVGKPGKPTDLVVVSAITAVAVFWSPPVDDGGAPISGYTVTVKHVHRQETSGCVTTGELSCVVAGLRNGPKTPYRVEVTATNAAGFTGPHTAEVRVDPGGEGGCSYIGEYAYLQGCNLAGVNLSGVNLTGADLTGVSSGGITGSPSALPPDWELIDGYLIGPGANLTDANLSGSNLNGADLTGADLTGVISGGITGTPSALPSGWILTVGFLIGPGANLSGDNLSGADLDGVISGGITGKPKALPTDWRLIGGYLIGPDADLSGANLSGLNLGRADLAGAELAGVSSGGITGKPKALPTDWKLVSGYLIGPDANLSDANLTGLNLAAFDLDGVISGGITGTPSALPSGWILTVGWLIGPGANLSGADLSAANFAGLISGGITGNPSLPSNWTLVDGYLLGPDADLAGAMLADATMKYSDLSGANLNGAMLTGATMGDSDLSGANFNGAVLEGAAIGFANLSGATFASADLNGARFDHSNLTGVNLSDANLSAVSMSYANLSGANLSGANLTGIIWRDTTCPDGTKSGHDGYTCVNNLG
jgi:uncharacterized protein YjbI with pentapeptide repeats